MVVMFLAGHAIDSGAAIHTLPSVTVSSAKFEMTLIV
jgi:hypothetical protein